MNAQSTFSFVEPVGVPVLRKQAEAAKQLGMMLSAERRAELVAAAQVAFLTALIESASGLATVDDATYDLSTTFERGGKWRGSVPSRLARQRIIERVGDRKSDRPSRHRGYVSVWRLNDAERARLEIKRLSAWLTVATKDPLSAATDAGECESVTKPNGKESSDATI